MDVQTIIFYGRSGSGKGTQAARLVQYLTEHDLEHETRYFESGKALRAIAEEDSPVGTLTKSVLARGALMPTLIVTWLWGDYFIKTLHGNEHLILDGVARREQEAPLVDDALIFFERKKPTVLSLNVSRAWAFEHLKGRARPDDTDESINRRLDWYDSNVLPALDYFRCHEARYRILDINGEQDIEAVHNDIISGLGIS